MIGVFLFTLVAAQVAPEKLSVDEAVTIALKNAFSIRISEAKAEKARRQEKQAKGAFGPTIGAQGSYSRFEGGVNGSGSSTGGSSGGGSFSGDSKTASVTLTQPIDISGIAKKALEATQFNRKAAEAGLGAEANNLKLTVRSAYYNVLLTQALVKVQEDALASANARNEKAIIREREGAIPKFDLFRFQNEVRKAEQALSQAKGNFENAKHALNSSMSRPIETDFQVTPIEKLPDIVGTPSDLAILAIRSRQEVKQSEFTITALSRSADVQEAGLKPALQIQATHSRTIDPSANQTDHSTSGGIVLSLPIFDSGITRSKVDAAQRDTDIARIGFEQLLLGIALEVRNAYTTAETAKKTYEVALDSVSLATESLRLADIRYTEGAGILIDVTQAQADLTAAQGNAQNAKYQYLTAYANLLKAVGQDDLLTPEK